MPPLDIQKRHSSNGCYEKLVELATTAFLQGHAASVDDGLTRVLKTAEGLSLAQRCLDGPTSPLWSHLPTIKKAVNCVDTSEHTIAHINTALRLNPQFARQVARGDFMVPALALVEKAAPDPLPTGQTASEALIAVAKRYIAQGVPHGEAYGRAAREHPTWYDQHSRETRGR